VKLFDKSVDKATWLETMDHLGRNFEVHFLTGWRDERPDLMICGRPIRYFPQYGKGMVRKATRRLLAGWAIQRQIAQLKPHAVLLNCLDNPAIVRSVLKTREKNGCKLILDVRTLPTEVPGVRAWKRFEKVMLLAGRYCDGITYITEEIRNFCIGKYLLPKHANAIWTSGVNVDLFRLAPLPQTGSFRLIYHGGIISIDRGLGSLIQAVDRVRDLDVHLTLISSLREAAAVEWIERLKLQDRISLMNTIPHAQVPEEVQKCHAGILPFPDRDVWNTSSPIKLFEYLACGRPVIVTDIPAHRNVLWSKPYAFFARDATPQSLADAIRRAHAERSRFSEYAVMARQQVLDHHTWKHQAERLQEFLLSVVNSHRK
jgi:glycosyltransferase involved in cell wall biosynthesis